MAHTDYTQRETSEYFREYQETKQTKLTEVAGDVPKGPNLIVGTRQIFRGFHSQSRRYL
jgi:hypothetical protein